MENLRQINIKYNTKNKSINKRKSNIALQCYVMIALPLLGFIVFSVYPILWSFRWSMFSYNGAASTARFIGLENFVTLFTTDPTYWRMWGNTLLFAFCKMPLEIILAMSIALLLNQRFKLTGFFRSVFYLPSVVSVAIIGLIFSNMFNHYGIINAFLLKLGVITENIDWFSYTHTAFATIVIASVWNTFGINVMYLLAALSNVPNEIYESVTIDGASRARKFFSVTLPMIAPVFRTILLLSLIGTLGANDIVLTLTSGSPGGTTNTVMSYVTKRFVPGFTEDAKPALGYGCSMSIMTTIILSTIAIAYNKFSKKMNQLY